MKRDLTITKASGGAAFNVRVVTRASAGEVAGIGDDGILKVRLTAAGVEGAANDELVALLAKEFGLEAKHIEIVAGQNHKDKIVSVEGISPEDLEEKLLSTKGE